MILFELFAAQKGQIIQYFTKMEIELHLELLQQ